MPWLPLLPCSKCTSFSITAYSWEENVLMSSFTKGALLLLASVWCIRKLREIIGFSQDWVAHWTKCLMISFSVVLMRRVLRIIWRLTESAFFPSSMKHQTLKFEMWVHFKIKVVYLKISSLSSVSKITELIIHLIEEELGTNSSHVEKTNCNPSLCPHLAGNKNHPYFENGFFRGKRLAVHVLASIGICPNASWKAFFLAAHQAAWLPCNNRCKVPTIHVVNGIFRPGKGIG